MATRKDQLHSYQFMMQRVISSVMVRETDPEQTPLRRGVGAVFGGVMLTGLLAIVFGVYGVISGNIGNRWQEDGAIIIERETGAHYLYEGGTLQPMLNYASARLLAERPDEPKRVPGRNLAGIPRRTPIGIPGAPDSLPPADRTAGTPWTLCSDLPQDPSGSPVATTVLLVGDEIAGSTPLAEQALLVRDFDDGSLHLIWHSHRYQIGGEEPDQAARSMYGFQAPIVLAGTAWLNGLPAGPELAPPELDDRGEPSEAIEDFEVGEVLFHPVADGRPQHYLVLRDGLAHLTELQTLLILGHHEVEPVEVPAAVATSAPTSDALAPVSGTAAPPHAPPDLAAVPADGRATLCARTGDGRTPPTIALGGDLTPLTSAIPTPVASPEGVRLADWVLVPPGQVAVVRALPSETSHVGAYYLVTDVGVRYPVPTDQVLGRLGYNPLEAVEMPAALVHRIPSGPTLDPEAARQPAPPA